MDLYVAESEGRGRGVFAARQYRKGELIELCDVIVIPAEQVSLIDKTLLFDYYFAWDGAAAIALGNGSLYNHSGMPNAAYRKDLANGKIHFTALDDIAPGNEILVDYNSHYPGRELWFTPRQ